MCSTSHVYVKSLPKFVVDLQLVLLNNVDPVIKLVYPVNKAVYPVDKPGLFTGLTDKIGFVSR